MGAQIDKGSNRGRRSLNAEINVTPFVDVMLVLLIVFMITAPLLTRGVEVSLPKASAESLSAPQDRPLEITLQASGKLFIQETQVEREDLIPRLNAITQEGFDAPIYFRADEGVAYGDAILVMGRIQNAGYRKLSLLVDPRGEAQ